jgi:hypothetical protein
MRALSSLSPAAYLAALAAAALAFLGGAWIYVITMPMAFLESGYTAWVVKKDLLTRCDVGRVTILGDSRPHVGIDPTRLPVDATNLALAAATPIENYFTVKRLVSCPHPPRHVILSFSSVGFTNVFNYLWTNAARFGYLTNADLAEISATAERFHDDLVSEVHTNDGLPGTIRNWAYAGHFPPLYFASLVNGELFRRNRGNAEKLAQAVHLRGHVPLDGPAPGDNWEIDNQRTFSVLPIQDYYFDQILSLFHDNGVMVDFIYTPIRDDAYQTINRQSAGAFAEYLAQYVHRYSNFHVVNQLPHWPRQFFIDRIHLNTSGSVLFSDRLGQCLTGTKDGVSLGQCDFQGITVTESALNRSLG